MKVEIEEVAPADAYADPPQPSWPAEDAAADAGAGDPAAVAGAQAESANSALAGAENEEAAAALEAALSAPVASTAASRGELWDGRQRRPGCP